jgi:hypothetical protein
MIVHLILFLAFQAQAQAPLPRLNIDPRSISVSGVSSGAFMAVQMQVAFSEVFSGVASVAGGVFWCAEGDKLKAQLNCMSQPQLIQTQNQVKEARRLSAAGHIGDLNALAQKTFYIFASPNDFVTRPGNSDKLAEFLSAFVPAANIVRESQPQSAHGFPVKDFGADCSRGGLPWLLKCDVDMAGRLLSAIYGNLKSGEADPGHLLSFSQAPYGNAKTPLFSNGWIYIPAACRGGESCRMHVALHGCQMNPDYIADQFASHAGYNGWAESNHIVVLYPQSAKLGQDNPYACWDWFGFTGTDYVTRNAPQMRALRAMIQQVSGI